MYNVVLVSGLQQSDSYVCVCICVCVCMCVKVKMLVAQL